jgi:hypothetical protein
MSSDTIYLLKQDKTLKPIFVQCPSVFSNPPIITSVGMYSDNFLIFCIYTYNLKELRKQYENDATRDPINSRTRFLLYELKSNKFYELERQKYWAEKIDLPKNMSVEMTEPYVLKEWLKRGYLSGKLKKIASKIEIDANPIVVLTKFK